MIDATIVSTDDPEIAEVARKYGADVPFLRPKELARDDSPDIDYLRHALGWVERNRKWNPEIVVILQPTLPFRTVSDVDSSLRFMLREKCDSVRTLAIPGGFTPYKMWFLDDPATGKMTPVLKTDLYDKLLTDVPRQKLRRVYWQPGVVIATRSKFIKQGRVFGPDVRGFVVDPEHSVDIDEPFDLKIAELLMKEQTGEAQKQRTYINELFSLDGKIALVTGASRGIGAAIADGLSGVGAKVLAVARSTKPTTQFHNVIEYVPCDVTNNEDFEDICKITEKNYGKIDVLINAAGISLSHDKDDRRAANFNESLKTNLIGPYLCMCTVKEVMRRNKGGSIINITSLASLLGFPNNPGYGASKGGLRMLTKALAVDWAKFGIRVNSIVPGYIRTAMTNGSFRNATENKKRLARMILPRWGGPEDLVGAAIFLASDASRYITGQDIVVDGGWTAKGL